MGQPQERKPFEACHPASHPAPRRAAPRGLLPYGAGAIPGEALFAPLPVGRTSPFVPHVVRDAHRR